MPSRIDDEQDPTVSAYLALLAQDMAAHPERVAALTEKELSRLRRLTDGVDACDDDLVSDDVML